MRFTLPVAAAALVSLTIPAGATTGFGLQGTTVLGGSASFAVESQDVAISEDGDTVDLGSTGRVALNVTPLVGYFVSEGFLLGGGLTLGTESREQLDLDGDGTITTTTTFGLQFLPTYYFGAGGPSSTLPFVRGILGLAVLSTEEEGFGDSAGVSSAAISYGVGGGIAIPFGQLSGGFIQLGADLLGVTAEATSDDVDFNVEQDGVHFGGSVTIGAFF